MGKKSKKSAAKAKAGAASLPAKSGESGEGVSPSAKAISGILTSSGGGSKKQRCVSCLALLKDLAKACQCPGCSNLYCWRCERKWFKECPSGSACVNPIRRCGFCAGGDTMQDAIAKVGVPKDDGTGKALLSLDVAAFQDRICEDDRLSTVVMPFVYCQRPGCMVGACYDCFMDPEVHRMLRCVSCDKCQCRSCQKSLLLNPNSMSRNILFEAYEGLLLSDKGTFDDDDMKRICSRLREAVSRGEEADLLTNCSDCNQYYCYECFDDRTIESFAICILSAMMKEKVGPGCRFQCSRCYWAGKPCTNPNCPNEVGIPTKRCGGCHLDRYCSVECQAAAYPDHLERCKRIQAKRAAHAGEGEK